MDDSKGHNLSFTELSRLLWQKSAPYRAGFVLGTLAVSATLILIFTGRRSPRLQFESKSAVLIDESSPSSKTFQNANEESVIRVKGSSDSASYVGKVTRTVKPTIKKRKPGILNSSARVNINTASQSQLESLPKIGPITAKRIIDYRGTFGPFKSLDDLSKVKGIGPKTLEKIKDLVRLD